MGPGHGDVLMRFHASEFDPLTRLVLGIDLPEDAQRLVTAGPVIERTEWGIQFDQDGHVRWNINGSESHARECADWYRSRQVAVTPMKRTVLVGEWERAE